MQNRFKKYIYIFVFILSINSLYAEEYYISDNGDDQNDGLSEFHPIRSIEKLNTIINNLKPGDAIYFERGSIFNGQININNSGAEGNPIIFGAYGKGKNPVISGSVPVTNWSVYKKNIFKANTNEGVKNLFFNEEEMILARYPNTGYLYIDLPFPDPKNGLYDKALNQNNGYWNGSNVRIRTENWSYEYSVIQNFKNGNIFYSHPLFYPSLKGWGYYLDNKLNELDAEKEWYFEKKVGGNNVFLYPPGRSNPNEMNIQGTIYDYGLYSFKEISNVIIRDIEFRNQYVSGVYLIGSKQGNIIENCTFAGQFNRGIFINNTENNYIYNCRFLNINGQALYILNAVKTVISYNIFQNTGMIPGYGTTGDPFPMSAIVVLSGGSNQITNNYIDKVGHDGINCLGQNNVVEKNIIKNCLLLLNDGGAIKCFGDYSNHSVWKNNFIFNVTGNTENTPGSNKIALGIYLDGKTNNMTIANNTIANSGFSGIGLNDGYNNLITSNICYGNSVGLNFYQNGQGKNNRFTKNVFFGTNSDQVSVEIELVNSTNSPGKFDSNYYFNPSNYNTFRFLHNNVLSVYDYAKWKELMKTDPNSKLTVDKEVSNSMLYINMNDDSLIIPLRPDLNYKDLDLNNVNGSVILQPWTSQILLVSMDMKNSEDLNTGGGPLNFGKIDEGYFPQPLWYLLSGDNLPGAVKITAPDGFVISEKDDADFSSVLTLIPENGKIEKIIFVKFVPDKKKGYYGIISNRSGEVVSNVKAFGILK